jgi:superfamily II DNA or RNA helicase
MDFIYFLYCVSSVYTDKHGTKKLGSTIHPVHRMRVYNTGDAPNIDLEKRYDGLWQVNAKSRAELLNLEKHLHNHFSPVRQLRAGKNTEWFAVSFEEVDAFINSQNYVVRQLSIEEVSIIQAKSECDILLEEMNDFITETNLIAEQNLLTAKSTSTSPIKKETLYEKFIHIFLPGKIPRRIQTELWNLFQDICNNPLHMTYRGIVQWPTGVGKTIATLMLIVIAAERCKAKGEIYRGLFVSPKNDILDTISKDFNALSEFGITLYDGSHGKLSPLIIPTNCHVLITACQQALINHKGMRQLPAINHVHYDEVHRITGEQYFQLLKEMLLKWNTEFLTGTSATPFTCSPSQREKITELFGNPLNLLHRCGVDEAVKEGWIAKPRFIISILPPIDETDAHLRGAVEALGKYIKLKATGGKFICYIETRKDDVRAAVKIARVLLPWAEVYSAIDGERTDYEFISAPIDKTPKILFACQRYREGSDIKGLEMTAKLMGNTSAAYILLQICGRAGRIDEKKDKEGWCLLIRPSEEGTSEQDVLDSILLDVIEFLGKADKVLTKRETEELLRTYIGDISLSGSACSLEETIERVQAAYVRKEYAKRTLKEKYTLVRSANKELGIISKNDYYTRGSVIIHDPKSYFKDWWISWYHFLGVDTSAFPQTKHEWIRAWKDMGITSWTEYKSMSIPTLPANPGEMYEDYTNPDKEFGIEDEYVW